MPYLENITCKKITPEGSIAQKPFAAITWKLELRPANKTYRIICSLIPLEGEITEGTYFLGELYNYNPISNTTIAGFIAEVKVKTLGENQVSAITKGCINLKKSVNYLNISYNLDDNNYHQNNFPNPLNGSCRVEHIQTITYNNKMNTRIFT